MARRTSAHRFFSWPFFLIHLLLIVGAALAIAYFQPAIRFTNALIFAFAIYFAWSMLSRSIVLTAHAQGMRLMRHGDYEQAIAAFERSDRFLELNPWIDNYRWVVLMSASALGYREMALYNIAMSQSALGRKSQTRQALRRFLEVAPHSPLAPRVRVALAALEGRGKK